MRRAVVSRPHEAGGERGGLRRSAGRRGGRLQVHARQERQVLSRESTLKRGQPQAAESSPQLSSEETVDEVLEAVVDLDNGVQA